MGQLGPGKTASADHFFLDSDTAIVKAKLSLSDFNELFSCSLSDELSVTLGGYITHHMGRIPSPGEVWETEMFHFEIRKATRNKIEEVLVKRKKRSADE